MPSSSEADNEAELFLSLRGVDNFFEVDFQVIKITDANIMMPAIASLEVNCSLANNQPRKTATTGFT